jgi:hypothetical protein
MKKKIWTCPFIAMGLVLIFSSGCKKTDEKTSAVTDKDGNV